MLGELYSLCDLVDSHQRVSINMKKEHKNNNLGLLL